MKGIKQFIVCICLIWPVLMFCLLATITGKACTSYEGFAVDREQKIYIGKNYTIEVLDIDGNVLKNFSSYTSRGYRFTITKENIIKISTGDFLFTTDLDGNLIEKKEIHQHSDDELRSVSRHKYITSDGTVYIMKNHFLRSYIYRIEGDKNIVVYKMKLFDYIVKMLLIICFLSLLAIVPVFIIKSRKKERMP